ncbi:maleylpyruvate isomerase family mycothiol-dependent enzyme [Streptomyces flavofungini]|uniref:maleylpyruvate isomerase family mycothiol-dependent enzyme n=1 Tax=Streptomyces flavofungini TaxID=68200 RepID=UPI0025B13524|nr:maleylpyruvate isomerase family mycothiol-dependent enzyme [Streptomyces flavofungini]WJV50728.1 maleylpyruvate isomerase family mycothiol-dependent enzyme [Streptomyces flavofungini]
MTDLTLDRYAAEIIAQTEQLTASVKGADLAAPVPTCAGWSLGDLLRHVGGAHRWAEEIVRTRATGPVPDDRVNDVSGDDRADAAALGAWLTEGAALFAGALREAGPHARVWTVAPGGTPVFWARRMTVESVVHRADAVGAVDGTYALDHDVALDALAEWLGFLELPQVYESVEAMRALLGPGRTIHFHVTDAAPGAEGDWRIDLTGEAPAVRRSTAADRTPEEAAATARGSAAALLLLMYRRDSLLEDKAEIVGDRELFDEWREGVSAWLRR